MKLSGEAKVMLGLGLATLAIFVGGIYFLTKTNPPAATEEKPADPKILIKSDSHKIEAKDSKVTIVEFLDFECPACGAAHPVVKKVLEDYKGKITYVSRNFPLPMHTKARLAANAAEAAGEQGKYWEMYDKLFEGQEEWGLETDSDQDKAKEIFTKYAKEIGIDTGKFREALDKSHFAEKIQNDVNDGKAVGVDSTPTFFINGVKYSGGLNYDTFKAIIEKEQKKQTSVWQEVDDFLSVYA